MLKQDVLTYFGGANKTAKALGITHVAVVRWPDVIPKVRAYELERLTKGKLKMNPSLYLKQVAA